MHLFINREKKTQTQLVGYQILPLFEHSTVEYAILEAIGSNFAAAIGQNTNNDERRLKSWILRRKF